MAEVVHRAEGSATEGDAIWFLIVFGVIGSITMIILGAIIPDHVGAWWIYALALVGFVALGWWSMGKSAVTVELVRDGDGLRAVIRGKSVNIDEKLAPGFDHWAMGQRIPIKQGGGTMMHFSLVVKTEGGRTLSFRQMGGSDDAGWPTRGDRVRDGVDVFFTVSIFGLHKALEEHNA